jgi:squalene-associated FAD-dependent desaturase
VDRDAHELAQSMKLAVVGGGWAGHAAAVALTRAGHAVTLYEMAAQLGGRARRVDADGMALDNGQHILIGAYTQTLALMHAVGVDAARVLHRSPLRLSYADGHGLHLPPGSPIVAFARGVLGHRGWRVRERLSLLAASAGWASRGFVCDATLSVAALTRALPQRVREELIDPLCVAALNTPAAQASASVFLRVLKDALFSGPGSADLLLPCRPLDELLPSPARDWLQAQGATLRLGQRVVELQRVGARWALDGDGFDGVVLAATAVETARLLEPIAPQWAAQARALRYEPIVTVYVQAEGASLPAPMLALHSDATAMPAQFVFDHGSLRGERGLLAFVISGATGWLARGGEAIADAVRHQAATQLRLSVQPLRVITEKRATFACLPGLQRPPARITDALFVAGDYTDGPYPATLEAAVRSGNEAAAGFA